MVREISAKKKPLFCLKSKLSYLSELIFIFKVADHAIKKILLLGLINASSVVKKAI